MLEVGLPSGVVPECCFGNDAAAEETAAVWIGVEIGLGGKAWAEPKAATPTRIVGFGAN